MNRKMLHEKDAGCRIEGCIDVKMDAETQDVGMQRVDGLGPMLGHCFRTELWTRAWLGLANGTTGSHSD